jgi:hypothetical protein
MLIEIDISLLTSSSAVGRVHGAIEFSCLPRVGELVSLPAAASVEAGFNGQLTVEHVIHSPGAETKPTLSLGDLVTNDAGQAMLLGALLERVYGLFFDPYETR